jgi:hypothetical protein|eukprot:COSAG06_NODE_6309_length_2990_cov_2.157385_4_plen_50_part_00
MDGLSKSWIAIPIVSTAGVMPMKKLNPTQDTNAHADTDNLLLECEYTPV